MPTLGKRKVLKLACESRSCRPAIGSATARPARALAVAMSRNLGSGLRMKLSAAPPAGPGRPSLTLDLRTGFPQSSEL